MMVMETIMILALLSDIHANLRAFRACLEHARAHGATRFALLGDLVGYGAEPAEVVDMAMALAATGAIVIQGNHDSLAVRGGTGPTIAEVGAGWTHDQLSDTQRAFLDGLPLQADCAGALLVHASADDPAAWHYVTHPTRAQRSLDAARTVPGVHVVFGGHVHAQCLWYAGRSGSLMPFKPTPGAPIPLPRHRRWVATIGSVGQPRDGDQRAGYALWDATGTTPRVVFHRVPYDHLAAAEAVARTGLPANFSERLKEGR